MPNQKILQNVNLTYTNTIYQLCSTKRFASCGEKPWDDTHNILMFTKVLSLDVNKFKLILFWRQKRSLKSSLKFYYVINNLLHGGICKAIPCSDWLPKLASELYILLPGISCIGPTGKSSQLFGHIVTLYWQQACVVNILASFFFFCILWTSTLSRSIKCRKKNLANIHPLSQ